MILKFKSIGLENFLSFGDYTEVKLNDKGYTLIEGRNQNPDDNAYSNGSGKTSLIDAILYALTGTTTRGINKNLVNIHTEGGMYVKLEFEVDDNEYTILRSKDHEEYGTCIKFFVNNEDKSGKGIRDTEKAIKEYLPDLTESLISSVIILGQGMPNRFTNNTPSGRKEILETLSQSSYMIEDIKKRLSSCEVKLSVLENNLDIEKGTLNGELEAYKTQLTQYRNSLESLKPVNEEEIEELESNISNIVEFIENQEATQKSLCETQDNINSQIYKLYEERLEEYKKLDESYNPIVLKNREAITKLTTQINSLENKIKELDSVVDECPLCHQKLPNVYKIDTTSYKNEKSELESQLSIMTKERDRLSTEHIGRKKDIDISYNVKESELKTSLQKTTKGLQETKITIQTYTKSLDTLKTTLISKKQVLSGYQATKVDLESKIESLNQDINKIQEKIMYNIMEKESANKRHEVVKKMLTLASRDFRGYLLTNVINYLNNRARVYCNDIFGTESMKFELDDNNLNVIYDNKLYENLSGGEQKRIDIICQLSIRDMLCKFNNFSSNILVLDEFTDALDEKSVEAVINCITKRLNDVESTFIITHMINFPMSCDSVITVVKNSEGISEILK